MSRTEYSDEYKADALALLDANGGNVKLTADQLDMPYSTLHNWQKGRGVSEAVSEMGNKKKGVLADQLEVVVNRIAAHLLTKPMDRASWAQLTTALGTAIDKMRLLRGEATEINETRNVDELRDNIQRKLLSGTTSNGTRAEA